MSLTFGSVCSGIEAASVAWHPLGWRAAWLAEIEPFPSAVLAHHYPDVPNLGDMTQLPVQIVMGDTPAPDVLCGGTPCQAFSVAGLRKSLDDARGNLSLTFCEIANAIDSARTNDGLNPCIVFWENVPGVLNTKDNAFGCFLAGLAGEDDPLVAPGGKWPNAGAVFGPQRTVAWRVLDAQYFGVAQRRRRVFVVASAREDFDPVAVLLEFDGVRRDSAPSREAGERTAATLDARTSGGGFPGTDGACGNHVVPQTVGTLCAADGKGKNGQDAYDGKIFAVTHSLRGEGFDASEDGTGRGTPLVACLHADSIGRTGDAVTPSPDAEGRVRLRNPGMGLLEDGATYNLMASGQPHAVLAFDTTQMTSAANRSVPKVGDPCHPLASGAHPPAIALQDTRGLDKAQNGRGWNDEGTAYTVDTHATQGVAVRDISQTLTSNYGKQVDSSDTGLGPNVVFPTMQVRRLTPRECERLQGFPDDYTLVPNRGKPAADGPRYKALGNSWAVPNVHWIGRRIAAEVLFGIL